MAFVATPRGIEVVIHAVQNGIPVVNVFHVDNGGAVTPGDLDAVLLALRDWIEDSLLPVLHSSYVISSTTALDISVANGVEATDVWTTGNAGAGGGDPMAGNAALVISWRTASTGRSFRGRTYLGGLPNGILTNAQNIGSGSAAAYAGVAQDLIDALGTAGFILCVLSKVANGVARVAGVLTEIISLIVDTKVDSQRRRTAN